MVWEYRHVAGWIGTEEKDFAQVLRAIVDATSELLPLPPSGTHKLARWLNRGRGRRSIAVAKSVGANVIRRRNLDEPAAGLYQPSAFRWLKPPCGQLLVDPHFKIRHEPVSHYPSTVLHEYLHFYSQEVLGLGYLDAAQDGRLGLNFRRALEATDEYNQMRSIRTHADQIFSAWRRDLKTPQPEAGAEDQFDSWRAALRYTEYLMLPGEFFVRICMEKIIIDGSWAVLTPSIRDTIADSLELESRFTEERVRIYMSVPTLVLPRLRPTAATVAATWPSIVKMQEMRKKYGN